MLVITRKDQEGFVLIDEDGNTIARVVVVKTTNGKAQVGVEAPASVKILRDELRR